MTLKMATDGLFRMTEMISRFNLSVLIVLLLFAVTNHGECGTPSREDQAQPTLLVIMAPGGPVFARLDITVDRRPYREWVTELLTSRLDLNRDGLLSEEELQLIPQRLLAQARISDAAQLLKSFRPAESVSDQKSSTETMMKGAGTKTELPPISVSQFKEWFADQLAQGFNIVATPVAASDAVRLSALIDSNNDGMVTAEEIRTAANQLKYRDLDDDQTFTAAELLPYRDPRNQQVALVPEVANLPMSQVVDQASAKRTAEQICRRYGASDSIATSQLRLPVGALPASSGSEFLNLPQLTTWLLNQIEFDEQQPLHLDLKIRLSDRANASRLEVNLTDTAKSICTVEMFRNNSRCKLLVDGMPIEIRSRGGSKDSRGFMVNFLLQRMTTYDQDKDRSLSEEEFPALQAELASQLQVNGTFEELDLNSDGMLLRNEVKGFIERDTLATQSRIEVSVRQDGRTLFKLIDQNSDRRLSPRELQNGFEPLKEFDFDQDERVSESEMGTSYILTIGLGQAEALRRQPMRMQGGNMPSMDAVLPGVDGLKGPEWFRRMDRNQDGDVSWREFLGERSNFDSIDADKDNLISPEEATAYQGG